MVRRYIKSDADASDVTQQVFVRAFKGLVAFRGASSVRSWLFRIAINCKVGGCRSFYQKLRMTRLTGFPTSVNRWFA